MTNLEHAFQPAIDALEKDLAQLERDAAALVTSINVLRAKAGLPPRPGGGVTLSPETAAATLGGAQVKLHSDSFTGKKLQSAIREYLEMRKASGADAPATSREIFDALKEGGFSSGAKDDATAMVVLRNSLRKNTTMFAKLGNGKYGLRSWYPNLKPSKADGAKPNAEAEECQDTEAATPKKAAAA